jgi:hypothetical protein
MEATPGDVVPRPDILPEMVMMQKHMDQELSTLQLVHSGEINPCHFRVNSGAWQNPPCLTKGQKRPTFH